MAIRQIAVEPDAHEASGQHVHQESAAELSGRQSHEPLTTFVSIVLVSEGHPTRLVRDEATVGDGHPVGVAS